MRTSSSTPAGPSVPRVPRRAAAHPGRRAADALDPALRGPGDHGRGRGPSDQRAAAAALRLLGRQPGLHPRRHEGPHDDRLHAGQDARGGPGRAARRGHSAAGRRLKAKRPGELAGPLRPKLGVCAPLVRGLAALRDLVVAVDVGRVAARSAVDLVGGAVLGVDAVVARAAADGVLAGPAGDVVVAAAAADRVVARAAGHAVAAGAAVDLVLVLAADDEVLAGAAVDLVVAGAGVDLVVAGAAVDRVVAAVGVHEVVAVAAAHLVLAGA